MICLRVIMRSYFQNSCFVFYRGIQTPRNNKSTRPGAFICFSMFGYPDKTLALVLEIVHELPPRLPNLTHSRHRQERKLYKCRNNSITSIAIFHTSSVGLRYSLVFTCFSFFISIELITKRNRYICVSICLMFQRILVNAYFQQAAIHQFSSTD